MKHRCFVEGESVHAVLPDAGAAIVSFIVVCHGGAEGGCKLLGFSEERSRGMGGDGRGERFIAGGRAH
jgi:hypothetical protein